MESLEFIIYLLIGLFLIGRSFFKRSKNNADVLTEDMSGNLETEKQTPETSWEDLMRELKRATETATQTEQTAQPVYQTKTETQQQVTNVEKIETKQPKPTQQEKQKQESEIKYNTKNEQTHNETFQWDLEDMDELKKAIVYSEILNRKEY